MRHDSSVFFGWNFICFLQKEPIKVPFWWHFTWTVESLKFQEKLTCDFKYDMTNLVNVHPNVMLDKSSV